VATTAELWVNDVHGQINRTRVRRIEQPTDLEAVRRVIGEAGSRAEAVAIAGGRHAMGGQQFVSDGVLLDTSRLDRLLAFDPDRGTVEFEAGIQWPALVARLREAQGGSPGWGIWQKQTGGDRMSLGGAISANAHGRVLTRRPMIGDVESLVLLGPDGELRRCDRNENADLFGLVVGGYGLFGVIVSATLRLAPRVKLRRDVELLPVSGLASGFERRVAAGHLYGDFQFDHRLERGVFSTYAPVDDERPVPQDQRALTDANWRDLIYLAHADKVKAFEAYASHYLATDGQLYWSDTMQLSPYFDGYHVDLDRRLGASAPASELLTELYVPRPRLIEFLREARDDFERKGVDLIYGTIRIIERDDETVIPWAREAYAGVIFNLHTVHTADGIAHSAAAFQRLIDMAIRYGGSFYLTYHRFARPDQVLACYPRFPEFLRRKRAHDPHEVFQSDWYRHYRDAFQR
jgi:FAD/FMN-containing dehydrogenase